MILCDCMVVPLDGNTIQSQFVMPLVVALSHTLHMASHEGFQSCKNSRFKLNDLW